MMNVDEIKKVLVGNEYSFRELDTFMMAQGYLSMIEHGATNWVKNNCGAIYGNDALCRPLTDIDFEIVSDNGEEDFHVKVTNVDQFI